jgi:hypothetical protein
MWKVMGLGNVCKDINKVGKISEMDRNVGDCKALAKSSGLKVKTIPRSWQCSRVAEGMLGGVGELLQIPKGACEGSR